MTILIEEYGGCLEQVHVFRSDTAALQFMGEELSHDGEFTMEDFTKLDNEQNEGGYSGKCYRMYEPTIHGLIG